MTNLLDSECSPYVPLTRSADTLPSNVPVVGDAFNYQIRFRMTSDSKQRSTSNPGENLAGAIVVVSGLVKEIQEVCDFIP
jgi:hypothetical protein